MVAHLRDGADYAVMPSLDGALSLDQSMSPAAGSATLRITDNVLNEVWLWTFKAVSRSAGARWRLLGTPPVVWHFVPPTRDRRPLLLFAVYRDTPVTVTKSGPRFTRFRVKDDSFERRLFDRLRREAGGAERSHSSEHPSHHRSAEPDLIQFPDDGGYLEVDLTPDVTMLRVQNASLMPRFDDPAAIPGSIGSAHLLLPGGETAPVGRDELEASGSVAFRSLESRMGHSRAETAAKFGVLVLPHPGGVTFQGMDKTFQVQVSIKKPNRAAAFAYDVGVGYGVKVFLIDHDDNVSVTVQTSPDLIVKTLHVFHRERASGGLVPQQGAAVDFDASAFDHVDLPDPSIQAVTLALQVIVETGIGLIPVVGSLYALGQLAYMYATGEDFFGHSVSSGEILLYGSLAAVTIGGPAAFRLTRTTREGLAPLLEAMERAAPSIDDAVARIGVQAGAAEEGASLLREIAAMPAAAREELGQRVLAAWEAGDAPRAVGAIAEALPTTPAAARIHDARVAELFTHDLANFANPTLRWEYESYLRTRLLKGRLGGNADPLSWLRLTRSPWARAYLTQLLGGDHQAVIRASLARAAVPTAETLTMAHLELYDVLIKLGPSEYGPMGRLAGKLEHFRKFFELDHIIEQRFLASNVTWNDTLPAFQAFMTFLVPRNTAVALEMLRLDPGSHLIRYVHHAKTDLMRMWIPHGAEHLFTVQQITDATLGALKSLGAHDYLDFRRLKADFAFLAKSRNSRKPIIRSPQQLSEAMFTAKNGWPQVAKVDGIWKLTNPAAP